MGSRSDEIKAIGAGCLTAMFSGLITALMLFINGAFVTAILTAAMNTNPELVLALGAQQFVILATSVVLTVFQWMMVDYVRTRFTRPLK